MFVLQDTSMMPGVNPKQMAQAMRAMGIKSKDLNAEEVIIRMPGKELVIKNPQVTEIIMKGVKSFQVMGEAEEREQGLNKEDVEMVMEQAKCSEEDAKKALEENKGDIASAILSLQG